ncbi:hypothetical protein MLD38_006387 [Melastoma candidum]|uniref:Uncharacterized protein n=1 Tax=Melastoma candidum TaxID=119954 RepID=A0ACB9RQQ8_9MYRT|nr:hypothetical protein MLD38_006387 [Melastoma candidum]
MCSGVETSNHLSSLKENKSSQDEISPQTNRAAGGDRHFTTTPAPTKRTEHRRQRKMPIARHLHLLHLPKPPSPSSSSSSYRGHFLSVSALSLPTAQPSLPSQPLLHLPVDKLFVPPDTTLPLDFSSSLAARVLQDSNIVLSNYATAGPSSQVVTADYVNSNVRFEDCPSDGLPEFALVGRSNVGKSSLLNSLVRRKRLASPSLRRSRVVFRLVLWRSVFGFWKLSFSLKA